MTTIQRLQCMVFHANQNQRLKDPTQWTLLVGNFSSYSKKMSKDRWDFQLASSTTLHYWHFVRFLLDCTTHGFLINLFIKPLSNTLHSHLILMDLFVCFHHVCTSWWENAQLRLTMPQVLILQLFYLALLLQLIIEGVLVNILIYQTVDLEFVLLNLQLQSGYHDKHID
jgi:hypothetical protein